MYEAVLARLSSSCCADCPLGLLFQNPHPIFSLSWECVVSFLWNTEAACPIQITTDTDQVRVRSWGVSVSRL